MLEILNIIHWQNPLKKPKIPLQKPKNPLFKTRKPLNKKPSENPLSKKD